MKSKPSLRKRFVLWLAHRLPPCKAIVRLDSESHERRLSPRERLLMWMHFRICSWCQRYTDQIKLIRSTASQAKQQAPSQSSKHMPAESRARLKRRLREAVDEPR